MSPDVVRAYLTAWWWRARIWVEHAWYRCAVCPRRGHLAKFSMRDQCIRCGRRLT